MIQLLENFITLLTRDSILTAIVPATQIFTGPVDITEEKQSGLQLPQINIHIISESQRTVPLGCRDTMVQIDIWSRNSFIETIYIYERIINILSYQTSNEGPMHIYWDKVGGMADQYESDRRIFHRSMTMQCWIDNPSNSYTSGVINVTNEIVAGSGTNWTLSFTPSDPSRTNVYGGGSRLTLGVDYTISGANIVTTYSYPAGQITADYILEFTYTNEVVSGSGTSWNLMFIPQSPSAVLLYGGGMRLNLGVDYTISGKSITTMAPYSAGQLIADYS
jgi:hypothetical protein